MSTKEDNAKRTIESAKRRFLRSKHRLAAEAILVDCLDRGGIKHEFRQIDSHVLNDIIDMWTEIIKQASES